ncbi:CHAT domain-containing protein [Daldinia vernicosa]|uniref:CHAT domain-containing protein n=1 Tax=Daldinia vernicosa TaxID=114800 RepID=UPI0020075CC5|nr:CHAT domain-containing protein [Daldinia vernicosa]KAI0854039.1 CHAT domain-containing protein [Daldinia vernicosa]
MADLEEAIKVIRHGVESIPHNNPSRALWLSNLGYSLQCRYKQKGELIDLKEAIEAAREALELTPDDNILDRAGILSNLGNGLHAQYKHIREMTGLEEAIKVFREAVGITPYDHPYRATCLNNLGGVLQTRYRQTNEMTDLEAASTCLMEAWHSETAIPFHRIRAASACLHMLGQQSKFNTAIEIGQAVLNFLPTVNTKLLDRGDQQFVLSTFAGVAANVCAFLLALHRPTDALEYLEKGRAVIIGQLADGRSDLSSLQITHFDIARRYMQLRDTVNTPVSQLGQDIEQAQVPVAVRRRQALAELDSCIREIRCIAGHERFLLGQTAAEMQECAVGGTIVIVNITHFHSDAILISEASVKTLNLPRLLASDAKAWLSENWRGAGVSRSEKPQKNKKYLEYLAWLWNVCVKTIIDEVYDAWNVVDSLPRIWWIGTGLGSSMPFHVAGIHSSNSTENTFSKAISSYTPSIKTLGYAQHRARTTDSARGSLLIATMPTTPSQAPHLRASNDLPGVVEEKEAVLNLTKEHIPIELLDLPSVEQVVDKLPECTIAHFACHGSTDHVDPSQSGLILQKGGTGQETEQDWLTVRRISELNLTHAHIAYLSACSTAENKAEQLADEAIHVVSGFQVAGFPHVIGCLWPSVDRVCVEVAKRFYRSLFQQRAAGWEGREVASALREAVMAAREADMKMPLEWAQFVHFGA